MAFCAPLGLSLAIILCACDFNYIRRCDSQPICATNRACFSSGDFIFGSILRAFRSRSSLLLENLVLRQQLAVLKRKHPRSQIAVVDRLFWVLTRTVWSGWNQALTVVTPDTVVGWHREGFALYGACHLQSSGSDGPEANFQRSSRSDFQDGRREPNLAAT